jgi:hypothetical protein
MAMHAQLMAQPEQCAAFLSLLTSHAQSMTTLACLGQPEQHLGACFRLLRMHGRPERELLIKRLIEAEPQNSTGVAPLEVTSGRLDRLLFSLLADARHSAPYATSYPPVTPSPHSTAAPFLRPPQAQPSQRPSSPVPSCCPELPNLATLQSRLTLAQVLLEQLHGKIPDGSYVSYHTLMLAIRAWVLSVEGNKTNAVQAALQLSQIDGLLNGSVTPFWLLGVELATKLIAGSGEDHALAIHLGALRRLGKVYALAGVIADSHASALHSPVGSTESPGELAESPMSPSPPTANVPLPMPVVDQSAPVSASLDNHNHTHTRESFAFPLPTQPQSYVSDHMAPPPRRKERRVTSRSLPHHGNLPGHHSSLPMVYGAAPVTTASNLGAAQAALLAGFGSYSGQEPCTAFSVASGSSTTAPLAEIAEFSSVVTQQSALQSPAYQAAQPPPPATRQALPVSLGAFGDTLEPLEAEEWSG